jgi:phytol kinase
VLVCATFGALLAIFSVIGPWLQPEVVRKGLHMSLGLTALSFPWLFDTAWPVVLVAGASALAFLAFRSRFPLFRRLADAMHGLKRVSVGEYCFVAATCIVFALAEDDPVLEYKTLEGSAAFFVVAFVCIAVPLAWFTPATHPELLAVAALIAIAVTVLEAATGGGFDNLMVPLGAFAAIKATGLTRGQPDALESGSPLVVAGLAVVAALLVLLLAVLIDYAKSKKGTHTL